MIDLMKYNYGFLSGSNGIFVDKNDNDNQRPKTRKTGRSISYRIDGIFNNNDDSREINHNVISSNINPSHRQKSVTKNKGNSKTKNRSSYKNKDIKYKNNKKKSRKKSKVNSAEKKR